MKIYDVTVAISSDMPIYRGDPDAAVESFKAIARGDSANVSAIRFGVHSGTHVDAPNHFIEGTKHVHELDLSKLIGPCRVIDVGPDVREIEPEHIGDISDAERIIFKTRNSEFWSAPEDGFRTDFTYITPGTAELLVSNGIKLVGIDYLSIERSGGPGKPVHIALLENETVILEGVDLREVSAGDYELICMPLKYIGSTGDGAPARTVLIKR
ncbi:cyclase family protein [Leptolyngbya sp. 7M]|uniref:cyclase family protein n=1 Tax=Leptolyngbya sp. 7M TaxID=2812896 RepID=UPI001B8BC67D|nr:cyclase family protein [Leptolyngbya sp. 7M]QYO62630.1 cyclase family protein [Leptolyngbya sp. 7M]